MDIRQANSDDFLDFVILAKKFLKESKYPFRLDKTLIERNYQAALLDPNFYIQVVEHDGDLVGMFVAGITSPLFSSDKVATELAWFLEEDHRDHKTALKLIKNYEKWAEDNNCDFVTMVDIHTLQSMEAYYTRRGYALTEKTYVKEL